MLNEIDNLAITAGYDTGFGVGSIGGESASRSRAKRCRPRPRRSRYQGAGAAPASGPTHCDRHRPPLVGWEERRQPCSSSTSRPRPCQVTTSRRSTSSIACVNAASIDPHVPTTWTRCSSWLTGSPFSGTAAASRRDQSKSLDHDGNSVELMVGHRLEPRRHGDLDVRTSPYYGSSATRWTHGQGSTSTSCPARSSGLAGITGSGREM